MKVSSHNGPPRHCAQSTLPTGGYGKTTSVGFIGCVDCPHEQKLEGILLVIFS